MEIQYSQLKINHLSDTPSTKADGAVPSTKAVGGGISVVCLLKDVKAQLKVRRTLSSVGTSSSNTFHFDAFGLELSGVVDGSTRLHVKLSGEFLASSIVDRRPYFH